MSKVILHIGLQKTGTSYFQYQIFNKVEEVDFISGTNLLRNLFNNSFQNKTLLISSEHMGGDPWPSLKRRANHKNLFQNSWMENFHNSVNRLKIISPASKIIVGFRKQDSLLLSLYKHYVAVGGVHDFDTFFNINDNKKAIMHGRDLLFRPRIETLYELFGVENCLFYDYAQLKAEPENLLKELADFIGFTFTPSLIRSSKKVNVGLRKKPVQILRKFNRFNLFLMGLGLPSITSSNILYRLKIAPRYILQNSLGPWFKEDLSISSDLQQKMDEYYQSDWKWTKDQITKNRALVISK